MKNTIIPTLGAIALLSGAAQATVATVGVYDENTINSNTVDAVAVGSSLTLADTITRVADAFAANSGGVWNFDIPVTSASSYELFYGVDQTKTLTLGITSNSLFTAVMGVTGGTSIPISGDGIAGQGSVGTRTYTVSKPLTMIAITSLQRTDKSNPSLSLTATLQDTTTISTTTTLPSASTPQILHVLTATAENPIVSFSTSSSSFARTDDLAFEVAPDGGGTPYEIWATGGELFEDDANGDGVSNGLAFLLGAYGPNADALGLLPEVTESGGGLVMNFTCLADTNRGTATLYVEHSGDLDITDAWQPSVAVDDDGNVLANGVTLDVVVNPVDSDLNDVTATISPGEAASGKLFGRLKATE